MIPCLFISLFDEGNFFKPKSDADTKQKVKEAFKSEEEGRFAVIMHNDPLNGMDFVAKVIKEVFNYSMSKAIWMMLKVHFKGKCSLWIGSHREANEKRNKIIAYGPDPRTVHWGAQTLTVTVEKVD